MGESKFTGGLLSLLLHRLLAGIIIVFTLGIGTPWAVVYLEKWTARHTIIDGQRLRFDGSAINLFGNWIKWLLLTIVTLGIYGFWVSIRMKQWVVKHTHFDNLTSE